MEENRAAQCQRDKMLGLSPKHLPSCLWHFFSFFLNPWIAQCPRPTFFPVENLAKAPITLCHHTLYTDTCRGALLPFKSYLRSHSFGQLTFLSFWGFPGDASAKEPASQCRRHKRCRFKLWEGKIPWRRKWQITPVFLLGEFHGQRSLVGYSP